MDASLMVSFPEEVSVSSEGDGELVLCSPFGRLVLRRLPPAAQDVFGRLVHPGDSIGRLLASVRDSGVPGALARFYYQLQKMAGRGFLLVTANAGDRRLATLVPTARSFRLARDEITDCPYVLSRFAYLHRVGGEAILESPLSAARIMLHDSRLAGLVYALTTPATVAEVGRRAGDLSQEVALPLMSLLLNAGMLSVVNDNNASAEDEHPTLQSWEFHDLLFHARSREGRHDAPVGNMYPLAGRFEPLPAVKPVATTETIDLYRPDLSELERCDPPLVRVMEERSSIREYGAEPMTIEQLGEFLYRVGRVRACSMLDFETPHGPTRMEISSRPYPTGGALYELEIYPVVQACGGLDRGLYLYDPLDHRLARVSPWTAEVERLCYSANAAMGMLNEGLQVVLILASRFQRVTWKYMTLAYALILKDVGVVFQNMYLAATAMGLAPCAIGVGDSDLFARAIGSDYYAETSVGEFALASKK